MRRGRSEAHLGVLSGGGAPITWGGHQRQHPIWGPLESRKSSAFPKDPPPPKLPWFPRPLFWWDQSCERVWVWGALGTPLVLAPTALKLRNTPLCFPFHAKRLTDARTGIRSVRFPFRRNSGGLGIASLGWACVTLGRVVCVVWSCTRLQLLQACGQLRSAVIC